MRFSRLAVGKIVGKTAVARTTFAEFSPVPYAEHPSVLTYAKSPYYTQVSFRHNPKGTSIPE